MRSMSMNWYEMISDIYGETKTNCILWKESTEVYLLQYLSCKKKGIYEIIHASTDSCKRYARMIGQKLDWFSEDVGGYRLESIKEMGIC